MNVDLQPAVPRPDRWSAPFGEMTDSDVERVLSLTPFSAIDPSRFPRAIPLKGVIANDTRRVRFRRGDLVVREGDYGNSAFFILSGSVRVVLSRGGQGGLPASLLGRSQARRRSLWDLFRQLLRRRRVPEVRDVGTSENGGESLGGAGIFLQDVPAILGTYRTARMGPGELFGEIAALGRTPRTATVFAEEESELLEVRWQGLRELRRYGPQIREHVDRLYRDNSLQVHLRETPLFRHLSPEDLAKVAEEVRFETWGEFDWYGSYRALAEKSAGERLASEPVIGQEGEYPNGVVLIRAGFARKTRRLGSGEQTVGYLGRGEVWGFEEIAQNWKAAQPLPLQTTLRALGYVDVLVVPTTVVERYVLPQLPEALRPRPVAGSSGEDRAHRSDPGFLEFLVERRFVNGEAAMLFNLDRCIHCDACVEACAATHDNNPRFLRHGERFGNQLVANACMHCADPVCMIGCPTGAIHRSEAGPVVINDATCIGCQTCARSCPYDNIRMVEARGNSGFFLLDQSGAPVLKATKCDLCLDQWGGPACQRACPHDALIRINLRDPGSLERWLHR